MANEIRVTTTIQINKKDATDPTIVQVQYAPQPTFFSADLAGDSGPYIGTVTAELTHTRLDLTSNGVGGGGLARIHNQDETNFVILGIYVQSINQFVPYMEILPGEFYLIRLSRYIGQNLDPGTGTGTADTNPDYWAVKADVATCKVLVEVFPP